MNDSSWLNPLITACAGLTGVSLGGWLGARRAREERRQAILREQLEKFYSPMVALVERIQARRKTQSKIRGLTIDKLLLGPRSTSKLSIFEEFEDSKTHPEWEELVEDESRRFRKELLPLYREMLDCFTKHMWLAEPATRAHYEILVESVDLWERIFAGLPEDMARRLDFGSTRAEALAKVEGRLEALRNDLRAGFNGLQEELKHAPANKRLRTRNQVAS
jgi:hypothetical protein